MAFACAQRGLVLNLRDTVVILGLQLPSSQHELHLRQAKPTAPASRERLPISFVSRRISWETCTQRKYPKFRHKRKRSNCSSPLPQPQLLQRSAAVALVTRKKGFRGFSDSQVLTSRSPDIRPALAMRISRAVLPWLAVSRSFKVSEAPCRFRCRHVIDTCYRSMLVFTLQLPPCLFCQHDIKLPPAEPPSIRHLRQGSEGL